MVYVYQTLHLSKLRYRSNYGCFIFRKHSGIQEQAEEQLLERRQALWVETTNVPSGITREDGSVQPPMTMNNYFHKHMLTHTLGRYHFKTTEEERIRLIQEKKNLGRQNYQRF